MVFWHQHVWLCFFTFLWMHSEQTIRRRTCLLCQWLCCSTGQYNLIIFLADQNIILTISAVLLEGVIVKFNFKFSDRTYSESLMKSREEIRWGSGSCCSRPYSFPRHNKRWYRSADKRACSQATLWWMWSWERGGKEHLASQDQNNVFEGDHSH